LEYATGLLFFAGIWGGSAVVAVLLRRAWLGHLEGATAALATATLFFAALVGVHLIPGILGLLHRGWVLALAMLLAAAAVYLASVRARPEAEREPVRGEDNRGMDADGRGDLRFLAIPAALAIGVAAWALVLAWNGRSTLAIPPFHADLLTFDLPLIARWIQAHSIWVAGDLFPLQAHAAYPHTGDVVRLATVLPWNSAFLLPLLSWPIWGLGIVAVNALARELGARMWSATLLAFAYAATPLVLLTSAADNVADPFMWAMFAIGALFLVRHVRRPRTSELVLGGIALGLALGSKWYALTCVPIVLAVWLVAKWRAREDGQGPRVLARDAGVLVAVIGLAGGFWFVRNLVEYGNPIFPHEVSLGSLQLFGGPEDTVGEAFGFSVAHYIGDWNVWREYLLPQYKEVLRAGGVLLLVGLLLTAVLGAWRARSRGSTYVAVTAVLILLTYLVTPQTAFGPEGVPLFGGINARYAIPGLLLGAVAIAVGLAHADRRLWIPVQLLAVVAVVDGVRAPLDVSLPKFALAAAVLGIAAYALWRVRDYRRAVTAGVAVAIALAAVFGFVLQRRFDDQAFTGRDAAIDWIVDNTDDDTVHIGMTGSWPTEAPPVAALFGPRLENRVRYIGRDDRGLMRHHTRYADWRGAVRNADLDLLLVGRVPQPLSPSHEAGWAARAGFPAVAASNRFIVYRLGQADPE
jgi:hypothetical protein